METINKFSAFFNSLKAANLNPNEYQFKTLVLSRAQPKHTAALTTYCTQAESENLKNKQVAEKASNPNKPVIHINALLRTTRQQVPAEIKAAYEALPALAADLQQINAFTLVDGELIAK